MICTDNELSVNLESFFENHQLKKSNSSDSNNPAKYFIEIVNLPVLIVDNNKERQRNIKSIMVKVDHNFNKNKIFCGIASTLLHSIRHKIVVESFSIYWCLICHFFSGISIHHPFQTIEAFHKMVNGST